MRRVGSCTQPGWGWLMNPEPGGLTLRFEVDGDDFTSAGQASVQVKKSLRQLGISPDIIRKVSFRIISKRETWNSFKKAGQTTLDSTSTPAHILRSMRRINS